MGNSCGKPSSSPRNDGVRHPKNSSFAHQITRQTSKRIKLRAHDIISIEYEKSQNTEQQPPLSPLDTSAYDRCETGSYSGLDESGESFLGIGIRQNPLQGSPTSSCTTASSKNVKCITENKIKGADVIDEAIRAPMLPPLESCTEEEQELDLLFDSRSPSHSVKTSRLYEESRVSEKGIASHHTSTMSNDDYLTELIEELEDYAEQLEASVLEPTPTKQRNLQTIRSLINKRIRNKVNKQKHTSTECNPHTPPKLKLPSTLKKKPKALGKKEIKFSSPATIQILNVENNYSNPSSQNSVELESYGHNSSRKKYSVIRRITKRLGFFSGKKVSTSNASIVILGEGHSKDKIKGDDLKQDWNENDSGKNNCAMTNNSIHLSETSSLDIFDQIRATVVPGSGSPPNTKKESVKRGERHDLDLFFKNVMDTNDDESLDLRTHLNVREKIFRSVSDRCLNPSDNVPNYGHDMSAIPDIRRSKSNIYDNTFKSKSNIFDDTSIIRERLYSFSKPGEIALDSKESLNGKENHLEAETDDVAEQIRQRLLSAQKLLSPKNRDNIDDPDLSFNTAGSAATMSNIDGNNFTPLTSNKRSGVIRFKQSPNTKSLTRVVSPKQRLKAVKKMSTTQKFSYKQTLPRVQNNVKKILNISDHEATDVKARITELNGKLKRTHIHVDSGSDSTIFASNQETSVKPINPRKFVFVNPVMKDKGAGIEKKAGGGVWTNYSLDGAGSLWKKRDTRAETEQKANGYDNVVESEALNMDSEMIESKGKAELLVNTDRRDSYHRYDSKGKKIIEYLHKNPCPSEVSPLTITSSELFGRAEKIMDGLKTGLTTHEQITKLLQDGNESSNSSLIKHLDEVIRNEDEKDAANVKPTNNNETLHDSGVESNKYFEETKSLDDIGLPKSTRTDKNTNDKPIIFRGPSELSRMQSTKSLPCIMDKENEPTSALVVNSDTKGIVNPHQQNLLPKGPPLGLCLSPVQRTHMQARKWRDMAATAAANDKDRKKSGEKKKKKVKNKKKRKVMRNILNEPNTSTHLDLI